MGVDTVGMVGDLAKIGPQVRQAHMLHHADRHDPVELTRHMAIIDQLEPHFARDARRLGTLPRDLELLRLLLTGQLKEEDLVMVVETEDAVVLDELTSKTGSPMPTHSEERGRA